MTSCFQTYPYWFGTNYLSAIHKQPRDSSFRCCWASLFGLIGASDFLDIVTVGIFLILIFAASLAFKVSFQRNPSSRSRQKSSLRRLPITLTLIGAISASAVCVVDVVILVEVKSHVRQASGTAKNMKAHTGAIVGPHVTQ